MSFLEYIYQDSTKKRKGKIQVLNVIKMLIQSKSGYILPLFRLCNYPFLPGLIRKVVKRRYYTLCDKYSVFLPIETNLGKGIIFPHGFPIVINPEAVIGEGCTIHPCVLIGRDRGKSGAPTIGDNCFIGHGAKIIGNPNIGDWAFISPGAIVTKNIPTGALVGGGINNILNLEGKKHVLLYK